MRITRGPRPPTDFTIMANAALRDRRISFRSRGVLAFILSHSEGWSQNSETISDESEKEGRDAIRHALSELEEHGYLVRTKMKGANGRWMHSATVSDLPMSSAGLPGPENPQEEGIVADVQRWNTSAGKSGANQKISTEELTTAPSTGAGNRNLHPRADALAWLMATKLIEIGARAEGKAPPAGWARDFDLLIRRDGVDPDEIQTVIEWALHDEFERTVILSPALLRRNWDRASGKWALSTKPKRDASRASSEAQARTDRLLAEQREAAQEAVPMPAELKKLARGKLARGKERQG